VARGDFLSETLFVKEGSCVSRFQMGPSPKVFIVHMCNGVRGDKDG
jgi:hypothetical protein